MWVNKAYRQEGNILSRTTLSLFYATDFADQIENIILPALKAGFMVLADRYIYTLMVRDLVRGADEQWVRDLYGIALVPDAVFYLNVSSQTLVQRTFAKNSALDYWESGMDLGLSRDMFDSFLKYQARVQDQFKRLQATYGFTMVDGERSVEDLNAELQHKIESTQAKLKRAQSLLDGDTVLIRKGMLALATEEVVKQHHDMEHAADDIGEILLVMRVGGRHMHWGPAGNEGPVAVR